MVKCLVTGSAGQLGQSFASMVDDASEMGIELILMSRQQLDITSVDSIEVALDQYQPHVVINTAAYTAVDKAEQEVEQAILLNSQAPGLLAEVCKQKQVWMIHISTDYVFDGSSTMSYSEDYPASPLGVYGRSKYQGELTVLNVDSDFLILRTSWVFSEYGNNFLKTMLRLAKDRGSLSVVADQFGGPTYAPHIARVLLQLIDSKLIKHQALPGGVLHFAGQPIVSWYEFANEIFSVALKLGILTSIPSVKPIASAEFPTLAKRPENSALSVEKVSAQVGTGLVTDWNKGIFEAIKYIKDKQ